MLKITKCFTNWCLPCRTLDKVMDEILPAYNTQVIYTKVDVEEDVDFASEHKIMSVPTMIFEHDGKVVCRLVGLHSGNEIKAIIDNYIK